MIPFEITCRDHLGELVDRLWRKYHRSALKREDIEDCVQRAALDVSSAEKAGREARKGWLEWWYAAADRKILDMLKRRRRECTTLSVENILDSTPSYARASYLSPDTLVGLKERLEREPERRRRQIEKLDHLLREFSQHCEISEAGPKWKELIERCLRTGNQRSAFGAMGDIKRNTLESDFCRAADWLSERVDRLDIPRSVFGTLLGGDRADLPVLQAPHGPAGESNTSRSDLAPEDTVAVFNIVLNELGAMCPSKERLIAYEAARQTLEYRDVRYHVEEVGCLLCARASQDRMNATGES